MRHEPAPSAARTSSSMRAARAAHEQQVRDVGARDQEHDADHRHDDPQHVAHAADDVVLEPPQRGRHAPGVEIDLAGRDGTGARKRKPFDPDRQHALDVGIGLLERDAVAQARDAVAAERRRDQLRTVDAKRRDEIRCDVAELEAARHDADDLGADGHGLDALADDVGIAAETLLPIAVREHRDGRSRSDLRPRGRPSGRATAERRMPRAFGSSRAPPRPARARRSP